jgi:hypothetical protein
MAMFACQGQLLLRPAAQAVVTATSGYRVREPLFAMDTNCHKCLQLLDFLFLLGSGSRNAAGEVLWFTETTHVALGGLGIVSISQEIFPSPCRQKNEIRKGLSEAQSVTKYFILRQRNLRKAQNKVIIVFYGCQC